MNREHQKSSAVAGLDFKRCSAVVLDFDQTLFLDNSTEVFLDSLRPRLLVFLLVACSDWLLRVLAGLRLVVYDKQRDFLRILLCTLLLPWNHFLWRRAARRYGRPSMNPVLLEALPSDKPLIILSYGFEHIIVPLLAAAGLGHVPVVCSRVVPPWRNLRVIGKCAALAAVLPKEQWSSALFITDSDDDAEVAAAITDSHILQWDMVPCRAFSSLYVPLRYTVEGKYPGCRYFTTQLVFEDLALLWLAYSFSWQHTLALPALFLSLFSIYEIGYYENDRVATDYEQRPVVTNEAASFRGFSKGKAWLWALGSALVGLFMLHSPALWQEPETLYRYGYDFGGWLLILAALSLVFWVFNHVTPKKRIPLFPLLHLFKCFSFAFLVSLNGVGILLLTAQVLSITANYTIYRMGGYWQRFNRQAWRLILFLLLVLVLSIFRPAGLLETGAFRWTLIFLWAAMRALEQTVHKNIVRFVLDGFRVGEMPLSRHEEAQRKEQAHD
ncbi:MAG: HAD family hydrolase [Candidatus Hydrogenedentales bacterium]|jgi:hypothetical protein